MSQLLFEDLEEGEIADDIVPEPIVQKPLPRRYVINDKKLKSRHKKKSCKHANEYHKRKGSKYNSSYTKSSIKRHKTCSKHKSQGHSKFPINSHFDNEVFIEIDASQEKSPAFLKKVPIVKSAFKNFHSPPRKVLNVDKSKSIASHHKVGNSSDQKSPEYKKSPNSQSKLLNISNFNDNNSANDKDHSKNSNEENKKLASKYKSENLPVIEVIDLTDDEDEEELRRIALATCLKRSAAIPDVSSEDSSSKIICSESEMPTATESDNYEIVDMDVDNDSENQDKVGDLFIIDTTPTYFSELNAEEPCLFEEHSNTHQVNDSVVNGFLPNINIENTLQNLNNDVKFSQNLNNDLYTNFEVDNSRLPSDQLDEEFEEELLRAELIANLKSMREKQPKENILVRDPKLVNGDKLTDIIPNETRIVKLKSDSCFSDSMINNGEDEVEGLGFREERTVSIVKDVVVKETPFITKSRHVSSYINPNLKNDNNSSATKGIDIKIKLNNAGSVVGSTTSTITIPQERIIISLNNETSSDESDQDDDAHIKQPEKSPAVASLEALISNARQESDGKKNPNGASNALLCLSKAQQEEYNSLIKILAKKKDPFMQQLQDEDKKVTEDANLILLKKKINIAKDNYEKEKALMNTMLKELTKKKRSYMLSKIKAQQLKEQLVAAEKVRKANLQIWTKCSHELQTLKKSVGKRQALIKSLHSKISTFRSEAVSNGQSPMSNSSHEQEYVLR